ncbi:MAG TPA: glycosyltransferase family 2 protein [Bacteroidota bacterium]|nr:glycosyltransferase family 2 protein [Bacteroidota bacterium]
MDTPLTYIIVLNWNGKSDTLECLASLGRAAGPSVRVVVVDNGSSDGSQEEIRLKHPEVALLETGENLRYAGGNNAGIRYALEAGAEQIMLLNNDTTVDPDFLPAMSGTLQSSADTGIVAPKILYWADPGRLWYAGGIISFWTGTMRHRGIRQADDGRFDIPGETGYASGCCLLAKRSTIEKIGLLDDSYYMYSEDADWSMRARRAGLRVLYEPRARVWHKVSVSAGGHLSSFKLRNKFVSNLRFFSRYASWYHWLVFPWMNVLVNGYAAARYLLAGR